MTMTVDLTSPAPLPNPEREPQPATIAERTVCLAVRTKTLGNRRKVSPSAIMNGVPMEAPEYVIDQDMLHVGKQLLESKELQAITARQGELRKLLYRRALPSMFKRGFYLVPVPMVASIEDELTKAQDAINELVRVFAWRYPELQEEAREKLGPLYDARDYPDVDALKKAFSLEWFYIELGVPGALKQVAGSLYRRELDKAAEQVQAQAAEIQRAVTEQWAKVVKRMVDVLTVKPGEKPKAIRATLLPQVQEFLSTFDMRNVTDDAELAALVAKAKGLVNGVTANDLRDIEYLRKDVAAGFRQIQEAVSTMVVDRPRRAIRFEDEEA